MRGGGVLAGRDSVAMLSGRHKLASEQAEFSAYNFVLRSRGQAAKRARSKEPNLHQYQY